MPDRYGDGSDEEYDDRPGRPAAGPAYPTALTIAGAAWIGFGALILLNMLVFMALMFGQGGRDQGAAAVGGTCGVLFLGFVGGVFVHVGVQSVRGTAPDTLGNGAGSLVFGALQLGAGVLQAGAGEMVQAAVNFVAGVGLVGAGVLALVARADYKAWRRARKAPAAPPRRRPRRDGPDDRDD